jgi:hypothetical protein
MTSFHFKIISDLFSFSSPVLMSRGQEDESKRRGKGLEISYASFEVREARPFELK